MGFNGHPGNNTDIALKVLFCLGLNFMTFPTNYKLSCKLQIVLFSKKIDDISLSEDEDFPTSTKKQKRLIKISDDSD